MPLITRHRLARPSSRTDQNDALLTGLSSFVGALDYRMMHPAIEGSGVGSVSVEGFDVGGTTVSLPPTLPCR